MDAYPAHLQVLQDMIPSFPVGQSINGDVVNKHVDTRARKGGYGRLESEIERHEQFSAADDTFANGKTVRIIDHLQRKCPDQEVYPNKKPRVGQLGL